MKILVTPRSLTKGGDPALVALQAAGYQLVMCTPGKTPDEAELRRLLPGCVGWLAGVEEITDSVLAAAEDLRAISRNGTGVDSIDMEACRRRGIAVLRADGANARGVAELTIGLILSLVRSLPYCDSQMKDGHWVRRQGTELEGKTLGVIGTGRIGRIVTRLACAMDMHVLGYDPFPDPSFAPSAAYRSVGFAEALGASHVITLHCPPTPGEKPLMDAAALRLVRKGAYLVNTARAGLVDDMAVLEALENGALAGYAVDVFDKEPPDPSSLLTHERVITTPHIGAFTSESIPRAARVAVENLLVALSHDEEK